MIDQRGWLQSQDRPIRHLPSPNFNQRPEPGDISLLVVHNISLPPDQFGGGYIEQFFCNQLDCSIHPYFEEIRDLTVSAHVLIDRSGAMIQFVSFLDRAWHAGASCFAGRDDCNDFSVGVELEGSDCQPFSQSQYDSLAWLSRQLMARFPSLTAERIVGHEHIAPGRKTDPGPYFNWDLYQQMIRG